MRKEDYEIEPDISVILPIYNVMEYLRESLDSLLRQGDKLKLQVIMVDDGSTDDSGKIADAYAEEYANFQCRLRRIDTPLQLSLPYHSGQEDGLTSGHEVVEELVGADFIGQRVIGENHLSVSQARHQTGHDGQRQLLELLRGILLLQQADMPPQGSLGHGLHRQR